MYLFDTCKYDNISLRVWQLILQLLMHLMDKFDTLMDLSLFKIACVLKSRVIFWTHGW